MNQKSGFTLVALTALVLASSANLATAQRLNDDGSSSRAGTHPTKPHDSRDRQPLPPIPVVPDADKFWNTNGTSSTWTATNWGLSAGGPFDQGWTALDNANFTANSLITFVTNTQIGNVIVADGVNVTMTAAGTYSTGGAVRTLDVGTGSVLDYAAQSISTVAGTGFIKNGAGIFFSANSNQFAGGFTLNNGIVIMGGVNAMGGGGGALNINGGTIAANNTRNVTTRYSGINVGGDFTLGGVTTGVASGNGSATANITFADNVALGAATRTITIGSNGTYTLGGIISGAAGTGLTVDASGGATGNLTLTNAANTYTGATTLNGGILSVAADGNLGASTNAINFNGGTLRITGTTLTNFGSHSVSFSGGGIDVNSAANTFTVGQNLASGALTKLGAGTLALTTANTYAGATTISAGTLQLGNGGPTGSLSTSSAITDNGVFKINRNNTVVQGIDFSGAAITGTGSLLHSGTGIVTLNVANSYAGGTVVSGTGLVLNGNNNSPNGGTPELRATADGALGGGNVSLTASSVRLTLQGGVTNQYISNNATLSMVTGSTANLNFIGTNIISGLVLGGAVQSDLGTYGSTASGAMHPFDAFFLGTGTLTLIPEPSTWAMTIMGAGLLLGVQRFRRKKS